jgi:DNA repair exonuclease SbcCD nuclease subunit
MFSTSKPETLELEELGLAVHGQGFARREVTEDLSSAYPQANPHLFNIGLLHTCLDGKPGHEPYAPCTVDGLRTKGYQYWALGHVHNREVVCEDPWIVFPGNVQGRHAREIGQKGCTLVTVDDREVVAVEHRELDVVRWVHCVVDVTDIGSVDEIYDQVRSALQQELDAADGRLVAARLILQGSSPVHSRLRLESAHWIQEYRALASGMGGSGMWLEKVVLDTQPAIVMDELLGRDDALGGLLRAIDTLEVDAANIQELSEEVSALRQKLPSDLLGGEERYDPCDPDYVASLMGDIKELLMGRLVRTGDS